MSKNLFSLPTQLTIYYVTFSILKIRSAGVSLARRVTQDETQNLLLVKGFPTTKKLISKIPAGVYYLHLVNAFAFVLTKSSVGVGALPFVRVGTSEAYKFLCLLLSGTYQHIFLQKEFNEQNGIPIFHMHKPGFSGAMVKSIFVTMQ